MTPSGRLYVWQGRNGRWYWKHVARNGREDNGSEQGYASRAYARRKALAIYPDSHVLAQPPVRGV